MHISPSFFNLDAVAIEVLKDIRARAAAADNGNIGLADDLQALHASGVLDAIVKCTGVNGNGLAGADLFRRIGRASLPVGRIVEGHANALRLVQLYGDSTQQSTLRAAAAEGAIFGVWGAEGKNPVSFSQLSNKNVKLHGTKQFCSGLGLVRFAVVPVSTGEGPQLVIADVHDQTRANAAAWQVSGMRATASGHYDFTDVEARLLGKPGDYLREPHFEGGIWRYCALHCGGLEALVEIVRHNLLMRGSENAFAQRQRLAQLLILSHTARLWVDKACVDVESTADVPASIAQVLFAREAIEQTCLAGMSLAERCLGTAAFGSTGEADRIRRDLAFFLRQANLDGKLEMATTYLLDQTAPVGDIW